VIRKWSIYGILVLGGILLGYLFFGTSTPSKGIEEESAIEMEAGKWTCAMHPNVFGSEHGTCPLCAMDLVFVSNQAELLNNNQITMSEEAQALANIQTTIVGRTDTEGVSLKLSGVVTTNKKTDAVQTILFDGRMDALYINFIGKKVRSGQEIGTVYSPELYLAQDKLLTSISYKETHKNLYESARNTLGLWKMTDKQIDEMIALGKPMVNFPLYADVTGTVTEVLATEGNFYKQGDPIYKVSDLRSVWVVLDAYEEQLSLLKVGQEVELGFMGLPNEVIVAKVSFVEPVMQKDKRTFAVRIHVKNIDVKLKPGMFAEAQILAKSNQKNILTIPKSAVLWTGKRSIVYKKPNPKNSVFELVEIELGQSFANSYEVISGLANNDEIVTYGTFTVDAAAQLMGKNSMMNNPKTEHSFQVKKAPVRDIERSKPLNITNSTTIDQFLKTYIELKDALIASDYKLAKKKTIRLNQILEKEQTNNPASMASWRTIHIEIKALLSTKDIASFRKIFKPFSEEVIHTLKVVENLSKKVYVQFCPMADEGKGASWLSLNEQIKNPYFGNTMLRCGTVTEEIN